MHALRCTFAAALTLTAFAAPAVPQDAPAARPPSTVASVAADDGNGFTRFVGDVWGDYRNFLSTDNLQLAIAGGTTAAAIHYADEDLRKDLEGPTPYALKPGATYGNLSFQFPLAVGWWITGHAIGSDRTASAGRDLVRAQISALSWTYVVKYAADRTRPNGDPRSFPSGHTSASFATAMVLQKYYGWKLGLPMFALATYTGTERITDNKHWASDVAFGAVIGMLSGRTVTLHLRRAALNVAAAPMPSGGRVLIHVQP
jgi:membrane-associated phospholipid phosphatase